MFKYVHHIEYIVQDRDAMVKYIEKTFGMRPDVSYERNNRLEAYYDIGQTQIQIVSPLGPDSDRGKFLAKHGPGVYHVGWAVDDVRSVAQELIAKGVKLSMRGKEGKGVAGENIDGTAVCNIEPTDSLGVWFQIVSPKET